MAQTAATARRCSICRRFLAAITVSAYDLVDIEDGDTLAAAYSAACGCEATSDSLNDRENAWAEATGRNGRDLGELILEALENRREAAQLRTARASSSARAEVAAVLDGHAEVAAELRLEARRAQVDNRDSNGHDDVVSTTAIEQGEPAMTGFAFGPAPGAQAPEVVPVQLQTADPIAAAPRKARRAPGHVPSAGQSDLFGGLVASAAPKPAKPVREGEQLTMVEQLTG